MRKAALLLFLLASTAPAQSTSWVSPDWKAEVFGGYSSVNVRPGKDLDRLSLNGWATSFTSYQFFRRWGLTVEAEGNHGDGSQQRTFLFGGTYRGFQRKRFAFTGRILAGATRWEPNAPVRPGGFPEQTAFAFGFGQAVDLRLSEGFALRVQPDLRFVRFKDAGGKSGVSLVRPFSIGVVYQFGSR